MESKISWFTQTIEAYCVKTSHKSVQFDVHDIGHFKHLSKGRVMKRLLIFIAAFAVSSAHSANFKGDWEGEFDVGNGSFVVHKPTKIFVRHADGTKVDINDKATVTHTSAAVITEVTLPSQESLDRMPLGLRELLLRTKQAQPEPTGKLRVDMTREEFSENVNKLIGTGFLF